MRSPVIVLAVLALQAGPLAAQPTFHRAAAPPPPPGTIFLYPERYPTGTGTLAEGERGLLFVPVNRADTSRGMLAVELWRFRATQPSRLPPVFLLHGGPGFEGLDPPDSTYHARVVGMFAPRTDLVVLGQRGIGTWRPARPSRSRPTASSCSSARRPGPNGLVTQWHGMARDSSCRARTSCASFRPPGPWSVFHTSSRRRPPACSSPATYALAR